MSFEEMQENCIQNKEKIDKWSKYLTTLLVSVVLLIGYFFWKEDWAKILFVLFGGILIYNFVTTEFRTERLFSEFPAKLGIVLIILLTTYLKNKTLLFSEGITVECVSRWILLSILIWMIGFTINCLSVNILDLTIFANPTHNYTAKIIKMEHVTQRKKHGTSHFYYAYFYDYSNKLNKGNISRKDYDTWRKGDVINVLLQQRIDVIDVLKITRLNNYQGLTNMEMDIQQHEMDIKEFGRSQEEIDAAKGNVKILSLTWVFVILTGLFTLPYLATENELNELMTLCPPLFISLAIVSIAIVSYISYMEYKKIVAKYTLEDIGYWSDCLIPRVLLYYLFVFSIIGMAISIYNFEGKKEWYDEDCIVTELSEEMDYKQIMTFQKPDGTIRSKKVSSFKTYNIEEGSKINVVFRRGALGYDIITDFKCKVPN